MRDTLQYPLDVPTLLRKRRALKAQLAEAGPFIDKRIALLGGSTTADLRSLLELFLLAAGIRPVFFESDYNRFFEDAVVDDAALKAFAPDVVVVHTTQHNIRAWPAPAAEPKQVDALFHSEYGRFETMWRRLLAHGRVVIVQNNFDPPPLEQLGHLGSSAPYGPSRFVERLNSAFADFAAAEPRLRINDIARLAAWVGLGVWSEPRYWYGYKMAVTPEGAAALAHQTAKIIRAAFGKTKKCLVLDLDNTLWGGVVGDDGVAGLKLGHEHPEGEAFIAFQRYCLALKSRGVLLAVCSKNDEAVAVEGFSHPDSVLKRSDFSAFKANWEPKSDNLRAIAAELNLGLDSLVFVDDNPFERDLVTRALPEVTVAKVGDVTRFAEVIDREGHFDPFALTRDDLPRAEQYAQNRERERLEKSFESYDEYLESLDMRAEIAPFTQVYLERIAQLTNKTNQFNLTTRRCTLGEISLMARDNGWVTLYGRLTDRFGDNGVVSVIAGRAVGEALHLELWLMSCRVLKRTFERAMFAALCDAARARGLKRLVGTYLPTGRNAMVAELFPSLGFHRLGGSPEGESSTWAFELGQGPVAAPAHIRRT
jgi:FkbH-like protein